MSKLPDELREWSEGDAYLAPRKTKRMLDEAADRIEQLEAEAARLRAAMNDMVPYLSRADYYYMEPQTLDVLREINGG